MEQTISGVRHVAVVTAAAGRIRLVMRVARQAGSHFLVTLEAGLIGFHLRRQLIAPRPGLERDLRRPGRMHFVAGDAGKVSALETGRLLHAVHLPARHPNHPVAPETVAEKIRLGFMNKFLLLGVILFVRLNHETLHQILFARAKLPAMPIPIEFLLHPVKSPDAVTLSARQSRLRSLHPRRVRDRRHRRFS